MANFDQILYEASLGYSKGCIRFGGRSDENSVYNGENVVRSITTSFLIGASSNLQVMRTSIKYQTSSISGQIGLFTLELLALERQKFSHRHIMEKMLSG